MHFPIELTIDFTKSVNMVYSSRDPRITKKINPQCTDFMMHTRADPNTLDFVRSVRVTLRELKERFLSD